MIYPGPARDVLCTDVDLIATCRVGSKVPYVIWAAGELGTFLWEVRERDSLWGLRGLNIEAPM